MRRDRRSAIRYSTVALWMRCKVRQESSMPSKASSAVRNPKFPHSFISPGAVLKGKEAMRERNLPWNSRASAAQGRIRPLECTSHRGRFFDAPAPLHLGGIVGRDCDHRHSRCVAAPGGANGPRGGAAAAMLQWRQASGDRAAQFPCGQRQLPVRADRKDERLRPSARQPEFLGFADSPLFGAAGVCTMP